MAHTHSDSHVHAYGPCSPQEVEAALEEAEVLTKNRGQKLTRIRRKVLRLLLESAAPAKAYDLLANLDGEGSPNCLLYTSPSPRDQRGSRMPSSA